MRELMEESWLQASTCSLVCKRYNIDKECNCKNRESMTVWNGSNCSDEFSFVDQGEFSLLFAILFGIPATIIIIVTIVGNFLVLCFKARVGKSQTMLLIWNLGLADFLVGVIVLPLGVSYVIGRSWMFGRILCRIWVSCDVVFCTASIVTLCIISVDRYIGVTRPLRYKMIVTKGKVIAAIVSIWFFSISILMSTVEWNPTSCISAQVCHVGNELQYVVHSVVFAFFVPAMITLILYWNIYKVAVNRERGLAMGMMIAMGDNFLNQTAAPLRIHCGGDTLSQQRKTITMHKRVAKTLGIVVSAFVFCWLPFFSLYLISHHCGGCVPGIALDISSWLGYCNSMINPVIYAFTIDEFKLSAKSLVSPLWQVLRRCFCRSELLSTSRLPRSGRAYSLQASTPFTPAQRIHTKTHLSPIQEIDDDFNATIIETDDKGANGAVKELVWSAKLYCLLINPRETGL